jgi:CRISPR-associated protein Cas2
MFDLPTITEEDRKEATKFRKYLLDEGFDMMQFSVYTRYCTSYEQIESLEKRISCSLPKGGKIFTFQITDKQYGNSHLYYGHSKKKAKNPEAAIIFQSGWEAFI